VPPGLSQYLHIEETAAMLRVWEPLVVPGLLETEEYARALISGTGAGASAERIDTQVAARMERQGLLGHMTIAGFAGHEQPDVAYMETPLAGWLVEDPEDVAE
jgi:hypothetical protein